MKIYVFGNKDNFFDNIAILVSDKLKNHKKFQFKIHDPNEDFEPEEKNLHILDCAHGIDKVVLLEDLSKLERNSAVTMHDFDIAFNLKLLEKLGKVKSVKIIAIPMDYKLEKAVEEVEKVLESL